MNRKVSKIVSFGVLFAMCLSLSVCSAASFSETFTSLDANVTDTLQYTDDLYLKANGGTWSSTKSGEDVILKASGSSPQLEFPKGGGFTAPFGFSFSVCFKNTSSSLNVRANYNGAASGWHSELKDLIVFNNGSVTGKFSSTEAVTYTADTWYQVTMLFDFDTASYDVYLNGTKISDTAGSLESRAAIKYFRITVNGEDGAGDGDVYIDNLIACDKSVSFTSTVDDDAEIEITKGDITLDFGTYVKCTDESDISVTCNGETAENVTLKLDKTGDYFKKIVISPDGNYSPSSSYKVNIGSGVKTLWGESAEREFNFSTIAYIPSISISLPDNLNDIVGGEKVKVTVSALNLETDDKIVIFNNGSKVAELPSTASSYDVVASTGENSITAKVVSTSGTEKAASDAVGFTAGGTVAGKVIYSVNFENDDGSAWVSVDKSNGGTGSVVTDEVDSSRGKVLKVTGNSVIENGRNFLPDMNSDIVVYEDYRRYEGNVGDEYFTVMAGITAAGGTSWINPWRLKHGEIITDSGKDHLIDYDETKWHKVKVEYNLKKLVASLYIDDVLVDKERKIPNVSYFQRVKYETRNRTIYYDNMSAYFAGGIPEGTVQVYSGTASADVNSVDYTNASFKVSFTERMDSSTLTADTVQLVSAYGEKIETEIVFPDSRTMTVTPKAALVPDTEYTLTVTTAAKSGAQIALGEKIKQTVKTAKLPFSIKSVTVDGGSLSKINPNSEFSVNISVNDSSSSGAKAGLFVGIYKGKACCGITYLAVDASATKDYTAKLKAPADIKNGGYEIKAFLVDGLNTLNLIDFE